MFYKDCVFSVATHYKAIERRLEALAPFSPLG